ncbi:MAG: hypothetical protein RMK64_07655 [Rhodovarius sp.]|nr:hypothetical protein [Rhodovarius sp.]MCX7932625.1 hypothetical protein [Rhodovarius sp.]MDW8314830.1 hypothetical protein [Rhodovarius sp.]
MEPGPPTIPLAEAEALARAAGLERAWRQHRADVLEALASIARLRRHLPRGEDEAIEPCPAQVARP